LTQAALAFHLQRMVNRVAYGFIGCDSALEELIWTARSNRGETGCARVHQSQRHVQVRIGDDQPGSLRADITNIEHDLGGQLFLYVEVPLLNVTVLQILIVADREREAAAVCSCSEGVVKEDIWAAIQISNDGRAGGGLCAFRHGEDGV
jgi:hypothetical protein